MASLAIIADSSDTIEKMFLNERRFLVYNSRSITGECCKFKQFSTVVAMVLIKFTRILAFECPPNSHWKVIALFHFVS